jgi:hypothetical protein
MTDRDRSAFWSRQLEQALGHLWPEQMTAGVRAAAEAERSGAAEEDALWAGKAAAANADHSLDSPVTDRSVDWESLTSVSTVMATILKATLDAAGIPVVLKQGFGWDVGLAPDGEVSVLVPRDRLVEANELIATSHPIDFPRGD